MTELQGGQLDGLMRRGHGRLSTLSLGRFRDPDLGGLSRLRGLRVLSIADSRALVSLGGIEQLTELRVLDLAICPNLAGLTGVEGATRLNAVTVESCNRVDDLGPLHDLPRLRLVQVEMRSPPSLTPLVGHGALEFVWLIGGSRPLDEIMALLETPELRMVNAGRRSWMRIGGEWVQVDDIYAMSPDQTTQYQELLARIDLWKGGTDRSELM